MRAKLKGAKYRRALLALVSKLVGHASGPAITAKYDRRDERAKHAAAETITVPTYSRRRAEPRFHLRLRQPSHQPHLSRSAFLDQVPANLYDRRRGFAARVRRNSS